MSKAKFDHYEPEERVIEQEPIDTRLLKDIFLGLYAHPKHAAEHWMSVMGMAIEVTRQLQKA